MSISSKVTVFWQAAERATSQLAKWSTCSQNSDNRIGGGGCGGGGSGAAAAAAGGGGSGGYLAAAGAAAVVVVVSVAAAAAVARGGGGLRDSGHCDDLRTPLFSYFIFLTSVCKRCLHPFLPATRSSARARASDSLPSLLPVEFLQVCGGLE